jgi:D-alanyl-D-alanine-carboxypeptidase/D-alanyl-D-alanine-endopeptidase
MVESAGLVGEHARRTAMTRLYLGLVCFVLSVTQAGAQTITSSLSAAPSDSEIRRILAERIDIQKQGVGIVVGVIDSHGRRVVAYGAPEKGDKRPLNGDTIFEIGSITKVFTALLAADMAQRGEVSLDDPIQKYLPSSVKIPARGGRQITLIDLATHTSALPRMPENFRPKDPSRPYADYTVDALYSFLSSYELRRDIGAKYVYSNLGFGVLGLGLAQRAGMDYERLVVTRICDPLEMKSTRITLSEPLRQRFAAGHTSDLVTVPEWEIPSLAGAGALRSSTNDLLTFLAAMMGYTNNPLAAAQKQTLAIKRPTGAPFMATGLGWDIDTRGGSEIISKGGATAGYTTFIGYSPKTHVGVVVLANTSAGEGTTDIGLHLLDTRYPLWVPESSPSSERTLDAKVLDGYIGHYELSPTAVFTVTREGDQLYVQLTSQPRAAVYPKSNTEFFYKIVDAQITFETDPQAQANVLILHQGGRDQKAKRIDDAAAKQLEDIVAQRFKDQKAFPGSEAQIRVAIGELQHKQPTYERMTPEFAELARPQAEHLEGLIDGLGTLQSITFKGVGPGGFDIYEVKFDKGSLDWRILLDGKGKVAGEGLRPLP